MYLWESYALVFQKASFIDPFIGQRFSNERSNFTMAADSRWRPISRNISTTAHAGRNYKCFDTVWQIIIKYVNQPTSASRNEFLYSAKQLSGKPFLLTMGKPCWQRSPWPVSIWVKFQHLPKQYTRRDLATCESARFTRFIGQPGFYKQTLNVQ